MTLTCQKRVINIVVGRRGWPGNSPRDPGPNALLPNSMTSWFPRPKPALPRLTARYTAQGILCWYLIWFQHTELPILSNMERSISLHSITHSCVVALAFSNMVSDKVKDNHQDFQVSEFAGLFPIPVLWVKEKLWPLTSCPTGPSIHSVWRRQVFAVCQSGACCWTKQQRSRGKEGEG